MRWVLHIAFLLAIGAELHTCGSGDMFKFVFFFSHFLSFFPFIPTGLHPGSLLLPAQVVTLLQNALGCCSLVLFACFLPFQQTFYEGFLPSFLRLAKIACTFQAGDEQRMG